MSIAQSIPVHPSIDSASFLAAMYGRYPWCAKHNDPAPTVIPALPAPRFTPGDPVVCPAGLALVRRVFDAALVWVFVPARHRPYTFPAAVLQHATPVQAKTLTRYTNRRLARRPRWVRQPPIALGPPDPTPLKRQYERFLAAMEVAIQTQAAWLRGPGLGAGYSAINRLSFSARAALHTFSGQAVIYAHMVRAQGGKHAPIPGR